jgi:hypothetical protein
VPSCFIYYLYSTVTCNQDNVSTVFLPLTFKMPRRRISADVQWIVVRLSSRFEKEEISVYTGISVRSIERILKFFKKHHTVQLTEQEKRRYQRTHLRDLDVEVGLVAKSNFLILITIAVYPRNDATGTGYVPL